MTFELKQGLAVGAKRLCPSFDSLAKIIEIGPPVAYYTFWFLTWKQE